MTRFDEHISITGRLHPMSYHAINIPCLKHQSYPLFENHILFEHLGPAFQCKLLQDVEVDGNSEEVNGEAED